MASPFRRIFQVVDGNKKLVGDGFDVTSPMPGPRIRQLSPFLLIDHSGPMPVAPTDSRLGTPPHPHRGFETVTVVYQGYLSHRDTAGHSGKLGPGEGAMDRFVVDYLQLLDGRLDSIRRCLDDCDIEGARVAVLSLESSSKMLGGTSLAARLTELRSQLDLGPTPQRNALLSLVEIAATTFRQDLQAQDRL